MLQAVSVFADSNGEIVYEMNSKEGRTSLKEGYVFGLGLNQNVYTLFQDFNGETETFTDEKVSLNGPQLAWGHDWLWRGWLVTGFRLEGFYGTTFNRNNKTKEFSTSEVKGNVGGYHAVGRIGSVFGIKTKNPFMGDFGRLLGEFFIEGGMGRGTSNLDKTYNYKSSTVEERYEVNVTEDFTTQVISTGLTMTSSKGALLELKFSQLAILNNQVRVKGESLVNGGSVETINVPLENPKSSPVYLVSVMVGYHW